MLVINSYLRLFLMQDDLDLRWLEDAWMKVPVKSPCVAGRYTQTQTVFRIVFASPSLHTSFWNMIRTGL